MRYGLSMSIHFSHDPDLNQFKQKKTFLQATRGMCASDSTFPNLIPLENKSAYSTFTGQFKNWSRQSRMNAETLLAPWQQSAGVFRPHPEGRVCGAFFSCQFYGISRAVRQPLARRWGATAVP